MRLSIFHMFVELDMSVRGIAHKLTEDGILPPAKSRGANVKSIAWNPSTVHMLLTDVANIGILKILKTTKVTKENGLKTIKPNANMKTIPGGLPAIVPPELYEMAMHKLQTNKSDKSHLHRNPEDFLLKGHVFCKSCNHRLLGRYRTSKKVHTYPFYACNHNNNKYDACPDPVLIRTQGIDRMVWEECCRVFERLDLIRDTIERSIEQSLQTMLEDSTGRQLAVQLSEEIAFAKQERDRHAEGSYYYGLITQDIREKEDRLRKYEEEYEESRQVVKLSDIYRKSIIGFLDFLNTMQGRYHEATFQEKRNALNVLGVKVYIRADVQDESGIRTIEGGQQWLTIREAEEATDIKSRTLNDYIHAGKLEVHRNVSPMVVHRDELNRFLHESPVRTRSERGNIRPRVEITYTPMFTGVQSFLG
ncbi:MAG: recombinase family protein [Ktedonobacteraceae bacterium]